MQLTWYFDYISPFAYLQLQGLDKLVNDHQIIFKPVLLAGLLNHWHNIGPAEIPPKRQFTYQHCQWIANAQKIAFKMPPAHPFNSLKALRLTIALGSNYATINHIFKVIWQHGLDFDSIEATQLLQEFDIKNIDSLITTPQVKQKLRDNTEEAIVAGVFGVPTFVDHGNPLARFWGLDAFPMLLDYLKQPDTFFDAEMRRISQLPVGVQRSIKQTAT